MDRLAASLLSVWLGTIASAATAAEASWIDTYIDARGGCATTRALDEALRGHGSNGWRPFGKITDDWTEDDVAALPHALQRCGEVSAMVGSDRTKLDNKDMIGMLLDRVPPLVQAAVARRALNRKQLDAREAEARDKLANARRDASEMDGEADRVAALERQAVEAEQANYTRRVELEKSVRSAQNRLSQAQADSSSPARDNSYTEPYNALPRHDELLKSLLGELNGSVRLHPESELLEQGVRNSSYAVKSSVVISLSEKEAEDQVIRYGVAVIGSNKTDLALGLFILTNAVRIADPGLTHDQINDILLPMLHSVAELSMPYSAQLRLTEMYCKPTDNHVGCAFSYVNRQ